MERKVKACKKQEVYLKRKLEEERKEVESLRAKNQRLEDDSSTLQSQCKNLKNELDSSWMEEVDTGHDKDNETENTGDVDISKEQI
jgi:uncharacterized protein YlxW (UPF0749 family)